MSELQNANTENASLIGFWKNLQPVYLDFEKNKTIAPVRVNAQGAYYF